MLLSDLSADYVRSHFADAEATSWARILDLFADMERESEAWLAHEAIAPEQRRFQRVLDARYRGQNFEIKVNCDGLGTDALSGLLQRFHAAHTQEYSYDIAHRGIEFVSGRLRAIGVVLKAPQAKIEGGISLSAAITGTRSMYVDKARGWQDATLYQRPSLPIGVPFHGPAIVSEMSATTIMLPGQTGLVDPRGNLILEIPQ